MKTEMAMAMEMSRPVHPKVFQTRNFYTADVIAEDGKTVERWRFCMFGEGCYVDEAKGDVADVIGRIQQNIWEEEWGDRLEIYHRALRVSGEERNKLREACCEAEAEAKVWREWRLKNK